jgi:hypothetical protein
MIENEFGCTDIIKSLVLLKGVERKDFCGSGYSDQILFTAKKCTITYQFEEIKSFIKKNNVSKIINTWGQRKSPNEFKRHIIELKKFCDQYKILYIDGCPSPSGRLKGEEHKKNLATFYKSQLLKPIINT